MKKSSDLLWFAVFLVIAALPSLAGSGTLEGRVRDARTHMGLPYVKVELIYAGVRVGLEYTDSDGRFMFGNVEPRNYTVRAALSGYSDISLAVDTNSQSLVDFELTKPPLDTAAPRISPTVSVQDYLVPANARKEFDRALKDMERKDCVKAIEHLENGLRLYDHSAAALNDLGNCRMTLGDLPSAEAAFKRAMALSTAPYAAMNLAETYAVQGRLSEAEATLLEAIRKNADSGDTYYALAVLYFKQDRLKDAEAAALQADSRNHRVHDLHLLLAKIYLRTDPDKVVAQLELYLKEVPNGSQSKQVREALKAAKENR